LSYDITSSIVAVSTTALYTYLTMSHIHMINIILRMESSLSSMLIFENLSQKSFSILIYSVITVSLYGHTSPMHSIELPSNLSLLASWTSLSSL